MASLVLCFLLFQFVTGNENYRNDGILHHINSGMKIATEFLGSESIALKVADFVVRAFQPMPSRRQPSDSYPDESADSDEDSGENIPKYNINEVPPTMSPLRHLVRLLGLQPKQISAVAVNALIFVAQMITSFLAGPNTNKKHRSEDLTTWILNKNSRRLQDLIETAKNESLPEHIEELIRNQESNEETSCIRLLVCKITPFVNKMQKAVFSEKDERSNEEMRGASFMYRHLPTRAEIDSRSKICELKYKECNLYE
ncbi:uncharacterized protein LOC120631618 [Pararge aegeria]|uniref:Jg12597 protein n=1 Tax=Pararge aegeria aegeria TaxID=348720 RepID=A0A8S4SD87_9NEOP|nr:uncharacterized protein LOC120631618 [Pararge aegeria]CAH2258985.1 jg12597 [Pararge aegeria aegeria]